MGHGNAMKKITLASNERIVTAYAERMSGPGWSNQPVIVVIETTNSSGTATLRTEWVQPRCQPPGMADMFDVFAASHVALMRLVETVVQKKRR